jgi:hypothetical protein
MIPVELVRPRSDRGAAVTARARQRFLHVANGTSTTRIIEAAGIPGACSLWADPLYEGPVPGGLSDTELRDVRMRFLGAPVDLTRAASAREPNLDPANDLREWRAAIDRHEMYDELILWFEHDLFDQLNLVQLLTWIRDYLPAAQPVSLICIGAFPGRPDFKGLGELTPDELASLLDTRQPVSEPQYEVARRAWQAFRQATPEALDALRRDDTSPLPHLAAAITRFLEDYPWTTDGLSRTERRLLELARADKIALWEAFPRMHDGERVYYITDRTLAIMADALSRTSPPLLTWDVSSAATGDLLRGTVELTGVGRSVLAGESDRVATCGIDRWLGGVHLQHRGPLWRWDDSGRRMVIR